MSQTGTQHAKHGTPKRTVVDPERHRGRVKWFNETKGFGFICQDKGDDVFVHYHDIEGAGFRTLKEGQRVTFIVNIGERGLLATKVRPEETGSSDPSKEPHTPKEKHHEHSSA